MVINESTFNIITYQYDWGIPIIFEAKTSDGFSINDEIVIVFDDSRIEDRIEKVVSDDYTFEFKLKKTEADSIFGTGIQNRIRIPYSIKRYKAGEYLETLVDANITFEGTVKWQQN